jgi:hypothetical protein
MEGGLKRTRMELNKMNRLGALLGLSLDKE